MLLSNKLSTGVTIEPADIEKDTSNADVKKEFEASGVTDSKFSHKTEKDVARMLKNSEIFTKSKYTALNKFVKAPTKPGGSKGRRDDVPVVKSKGKSGPEAQEKEMELENDYGVGFQILKKQGYHYGMGLGREGQGDPNVIIAVEKTILDEHDKPLNQNWICQNCKEVNEFLRLSCINCFVNQSLYQKHEDIDY